MKATAVRTQQGERPAGAAATVEVGETPLTIDDVVAIADGRVTPRLGDGARERMEQSRSTVEQLHQADGEIYGMTTSVGASVDTTVPNGRAAELSLNLLRMHGCGTGRLLEAREAAAVLAVRLSSLARGCSGVRPLLADRLVELLRHRVLPAIPAEGSVGASGDLTPLSYVAAVLVGEREVLADGEARPAEPALRAIGCEPLELRAKEALALMNGTSVATALGCLGWAAAARLSRLAAALTSMTSRAIGGNASCFDAFIHQVKPHPGQQLAAQWIRADLGDDAPDAQQRAQAQAQRLQDRYSVRCAPQVIGVLLDALRWTRESLETELNSASDNPVVDVEGQRALHGGNFYGGHVAFCFDALKVAVANVACLLDRQLLLLCNPAESGGLPRDLVGVSGEAACTHNGFKAVTIATSALAAEALKLTMPASSFSRSTELHNQDKVPMATMAARDLLRVVELSEQVAAMLTLANCQAYDLSAAYGGAPAPRARELCAAVRRRAARLEADRRLDVDIAAVLELLRGDALPLGVAPQQATRWATA